MMKLTGRYWGRRQVSQDWYVIFHQSISQQCGGWGEVTWFFCSMVEHQKMTHHFGGEKKKQILKHLNLPTTSVLVVFKYTPRWQCSTNWIVTVMFCLVTPVQQLITRIHDELWDNWHPSAFDTSHTSHYVVVSGSQRSPCLFKETEWAFKCH